jgi:choline dehydrogenase-like flavoprotein
MHPDHLIPRHAYLKTEIPVAGVAHQAGTCRFGSDPATSPPRATSRSTPPAG